MVGSIGAALGLVPHDSKPRAPLQTVVVNLKTGTVIKGVLVERAIDALVLRAASQANEGPNHRITWVSVGGEVVIPMENVDYWQAGAEPAILVED